MLRDVASSHRVIVCHAMPCCSPLCMQLYRRACNYEHIISTIRLEWEVGGIRLETSSSCSWVSKANHGPQCTGVCVKIGGYGFIEFEISNSTISAVFRQPLIERRSWPAEAWGHSRGHGARGLTNLCRRRGAGAHLRDKILASGSFWDKQKWFPVILTTCWPWASQP